MLVVGLTGDIGAGKTTLAGFWKQAGASVLDADATVREIWASGSLDAMVRERWGDAVFSENGGPDHGRIASMVFSDEKEYKWLCRVIHPMVRAIMEKRILSMDGWIVTEIPLLFENGAPWWVDETVYLTASRDLRVLRNADRQWTQDEIERREKWLLPPERKREMADHVLENNGKVEDLQRTASELAVIFRDMSACVAFSTEWEEEEDARRFAAALMGAKLASCCTLFPLEAGMDCDVPEKTARMWRTEALTTERYLQAIERIARESEGDALFHRSERIRRAGRDLRNWIREARLH